MHQQQAVPEQPLLSERAACGLNTTDEIRISQKEFLTNNWGRLQATASYAGERYSRFIKVDRNVATVANGEAVVRCRVPVPDGFYMLSSLGSLKPVDPASDEYWPLRYPDMDALRPDFTKLDSTPPLQMLDVRRFIDFLEHVRQSEEHSHAARRVVISQDVIYSIKDHRVNFALPFQIPVKGGELVFEAETVKLVFTEMLRYDQVHIGYNNRAQNGTLVVGLDWNSCGLIMERGYG